MGKKEDNFDWWIAFAILALFLIVLFNNFPSIESKNEKELELKRREEEEGKLKTEIDNLNKKLEIYSKHQFINKFTENYLNEICEKRYKQLIQLLIILAVISNIIISLTIPKINAFSLFTWNSIALVFLNTMGIFFFTSVKKAKKHLKELVLGYIEYRVCENKDKLYFSKKVTLYEDKIDELKQKISLKEAELSNIKNKLIE